MSELIPQQTGTGAVVKTQSSSSSFQSSSSSSFSSSSSATFSSSTKVVKQSSTTVKSSSSSSRALNVTSSGGTYSDHVAADFGIDVGKEMDRLKQLMSVEMTNIHRDMFRLMPGSADTSAITGGDQLTSGFLVKMDNDAIRSCIDKAHDDRVKLNFDINEFDSETVHIKTVGNKIEVHATKKSKKGDEERSEEFSRVYELPTQNDVDPTKVTSSIYKDGVLTIELPVADALAQ